MIMLAGIVVNAGIYIVNEYNRMPERHRSFVRAYNHKIIPISLTILSTVLGLAPFLIDGKEEVFWFAFAIGTIGGMLFSAPSVKNRTSGGLFIAKKENKMPQKSEIKHRKKGK